MHKAGLTAMLGWLALVGCGAASAAEGDKMPAPHARPPAAAVPEDNSAQSGSSAPSGSLSDKLSNSGGVLRPPTGVDPAMKQPTPPTGPQSMPVVPPPGTPGGNPTVEPK